MDLAGVFHDPLAILVWRLLATLAMTTILHGAHGLGLSRLNLAFLADAFVTADRYCYQVAG